MSQDSSEVFSVTTYDIVFWWSETLMLCDVVNNHGKTAWQKDEVMCGVNYRSCDSDSFLVLYSGLSGRHLIQTGNHCLCVLSATLSMLSVFLSYYFCVCFHHFCCFLLFSSCFKYVFNILIMFFTFRFPFYSYAPVGNEGLEWSPTENNSPGASSYWEGEHPNIYDIRTWSIASYFFICFFLSGLRSI